MNTSLASAESSMAREAAIAVPAIVLRALGRQPYRDSYAAMQAFTAARTQGTADELWVLEHPPVYTAGIAGRPQHFPRGSGIPLEHIDRGGQITYHGPGQAIVYCLIDLRRRNLGVRAMVHHMEQAVIDVLAGHGVCGERRCGAPGVYVGGAKIAALGLRVRRGACYHGLAFNVCANLAPFADIDPCGYPGLAITNARDHGVPGSTESIGMQTAQHLDALLESEDSRRT